MAYASLFVKQVKIFLHFDWLTHGLLEDRRIDDVTITNILIFFQWSTDLTIKIIFYMTGEKCRKKSRGGCDQVREAGR